MMRSQSPEIAEPAALARRFAALSGTFDPQSLGHILGDASANIVLGVTADLAAACDTGSEGGEWLMRSSARQREIERWGSEDELDKAIRWRRTLPVDDATADLLDALVGSGSFAEGAVEETIAEDPERHTLNRIAVALDRAGERAPAYGVLEAVRSALGRLDIQERSEAMLRLGFYGRESELKKIAEWLAHPAEASPMKSLLISGLPGIGKSTLVDEAARRASSADPAFLVVRLDFDRSALDVQDRVGLTMEISRQVSIGVGGEAATLQQARLVAAGETPTSGPDIKGQGREHVPVELSSALGGVVARARRPVLMLLDTMEVLQGRGATHPSRLFNCLDELCERGLRPLSVIAAGRGDALNSARDRIGRRIKLEGLDPADADAMLTRLDVPPEAFGTVNKIAEGNPLLLRLAARVATEAGPQALTGAEARREVAAAYLYRFLLSRIGDQKLRDLAEPGLVVRRINADVIAEVLAPALKLRLQPGEAVMLFNALATHHWLVEPDPTPGWVRHRSDIRAVLLRLLYEGRRKRTATRIDRAAAKWFARRTEPFAPTEAAYHELQAMRGGGDSPSLDPELLRRLDNETIAELPGEAQDLIRTARGERTSKFRSTKRAAKLAPRELAAAASELEALLERGDIAEASFVHDRAFARQRLEPASPGADIARTFLWRAGRWREATSDLGHARLLERTEGPPFFGGSALAGLAQLEISAEFRFSELVSRFQRDQAFAEYAVDLRMRGIKASLANGALGFALFQAGAALSSYVSSIEDPIATAVTLWRGMTRGGDKQQAIDALALPASRFRSVVSPPPTAQAERPRRKPRIPDPSKPAGAARLLATSTPYGTTAATLATSTPDASVTDAARFFSPNDRILSHLSSVELELAETGAIPPTGAGDWSIAPAPAPVGSIDNIAALGLLAEGLGAVAFFLRHPDLRLIARSAELWRRTSAGDWAYPPSRRSEPPWARRLDATTSDRITQLLKAHDPVAKSHEQLRVWFGVDQHAALEPEDRIARRFPAALREARASALQADDAPEAAKSAASALLERNVPSAFVPPLAVLISLDRVEGRS